MYLWACAAVARRLDLGSIPNYGVLGEIVIGGGGICQCAPRRDRETEASFDGFQTAFRISVSFPSAIVPSTTREAMHRRPQRRVMPRPVGCARLESPHALPQSAMPPSPWAPGGESTDDGLFSATANVSARGAARPARCLLWATTSHTVGPAARPRPALQNDETRRT